MYFYLILRDCIIKNLCLDQRNAKDKQKTQEQSKIEYLSDMKKDNEIFEEIRNQCKEKRWNSKIRGKI